MPPLRFTSKMDPNNPYFYLLDGGVADNLGVITAMRLLGDKTNGNIPHKVLVVIDSYQGNLTPFEKAKDPPPESATAARLMETGLDSWRARYREITDRVCEQNNIKPVYISFDDLVDADFNDLNPFGLTEQDKKELCADKPKNCPRATPFYLLRSISMTAPPSGASTASNTSCRRRSRTFSSPRADTLFTRSKDEILRLWAGERRFTV